MTKDQHMKFRKIIKMKLYSMKSNPLMFYNLFSFAGVIFKFKGANKGAERRFFTTSLSSKHSLTIICSSF